MGLLAANLPRNHFARRGGALLFVTGLHVAFVATLLGLQYGERIDLAPQSIRIVHLTTPPATDEPAPQIPVELETPPPVEMVVPLINIELPAPPSPITPPRPAAPVQVVLRDDTPVMLDVDQVNYLHKPPFRFPAQAKRARLQGTVHVRVLIGPDGMPRDVQIDRSSGHQVLDEAARAYVLKIQFRPHRENGVARAAVAIVPVEFALNSRNS